PTPGSGRFLGPGAGSSTRLAFGADAILRRVADHRPIPERVPKPPTLTWDNDNSSPDTNETQERAQFMSRSNLLEEVRVKSIFHPSDFSQASEVAFAHALKIALVAGATLTILHVQASPGTEWQDFPGV